jgi:hypothetical protein
VETFTLENVIICFINFLQEKIFATVKNVNLKSLSPERLLCHPGAEKGKAN